MKDKHLRASVIVSILIATVVLSFSVYAYVRIAEYNKLSNNSITALKDYITGNLRTGYRAIVNIEAGAMISESMVVPSTNIVSDIDQSQFISADDLGKVATVSINAGSPILTDMVSAQLASDYKERECSFIWLNTNLQDNDFVDVRILFSNGEDYIVAAKKSIKNVSVAMNNVFLWLTEEEILLLDAAIVDANMHDARIYVTKYVKPEVQEASTPTYVPNSDVTRVMESNPNIVAESARSLSMDARKSMEDRLELFEKAYPGFKLDFNTNGSGSISGAGGAPVADGENAKGAHNNANAPSTDKTVGEVEYVD